MARPHVTELQPGDTGWEMWIAEQYRAAAAEEVADPALAREADEWLRADLRDKLLDGESGNLRDEAR